MLTIEFRLRRMEQDVKIFSFKNRIVMSVLLDAINQQIDESVYRNHSEAKYKLASKCDLVKMVSIVVAIIAPIFAFFLPHVFGVVASAALGFIGYDLFNMADNLGDAARLSAEGGRPSPSKSNIAMLFESTILTQYLFRWAVR